MNQFNVSLWGDEAFSAILSMKSIPEIIKIITRDTSPPLYNITEHIAFQLFGTSEVVVRGLSFFYYLIAVFFVYKIGEFLWDRRTGAIVAFLSFFNPFFFIYAFEGRMYSILAMGVAASMYFFTRIVFSSKKINSLDWYGYIISSLVAMYSHHFAGFALLVQGLWVAWMFLFGKRKVAITMFKAFIFIGVLYLPWVLPLINQIRMVGGGFWLGTPTVNDLLGLIRDYLGEGVKHMFALPSVVLVFSILFLRRWNKNPKKSIFLASWFLIPILATWGVSQIFQSIFFNRYLLYTIPAAMLLVASERRKFSAAPIIMLMGFFVIISTFYFFNPTKDPFNNLAEYVRENKRGDDFIIHGDPGNHQLWESKYYGISAPIYTPQSKDLPFFVGTALMEDTDIITTLPPKVRRIGVITPHEVDAAFLPNYTKGEAVAFGNLRLTWFVRK